MADRGAKRTPEEWGEAFQAQRDTFVGYTAALERLLPQLLSQARIPFVQIEGRTKQAPNFVSKLRRKQEKYADPLAEVTDLSGIRVVLYYLDDVERVGELISEQFLVDAENSVDKGASLDPDRFGYLSVHYVVRPSATRRDLPEWRVYADLAAEIQVRTVLQHAWGAISRKLAYASVREAPRELQRSLNRLSALLELADDEFVDIRVARDEIEAEYDRELERGNLDLEIDESSLDVYLRESGARSRLIELGLEAGSPTTEDKAERHWDGDVPEDFLELVRREETRTLLGAIDELGMTRISELDERLSGLWRHLPGFMEFVNGQYAEKDLPLAADSLTWLGLILLWSGGTPAERFEDLGYVGELAEAAASYRPDPA